MRLNTSNVGGGLVAAGLLFLLGGCTDSGDGSSPPPAASAEVVESRPGIVQVGDDDGPVLGEAETCERFRAAVVRNRERLECDSSALLECPELIRPLASLSCVPYSEASLTTCLAAYDEASDCDELLPGACVLTAVLFLRDPACVPDASTDDAGRDADAPETDGGSEPDSSTETALDGSPGGETTTLDGGETRTSGEDASAVTDAPADDAGSSSAVEPTSAPSLDDASTPPVQSTATGVDGG